MSYNRLRAGGVTILIACPTNGRTADHRQRHIMKPRLFTFAMFGIAATLALTGCSGGGSDKYVLRDSSTMRTIAVDGANMVVETMNCDDEVDEDRSEGKMNDSRTYVSWHIDDGEYHGDDNIMFSSDDER